MAYFQMDKSPKSNQLETDEDFNQLADRFYKLAQTYMKFLIRNALNIIEYTEPLVSNAAFTCELYLKSLLLRERFNFYTVKKPKNKHDLFDLYNHLSQQIRDKIKNIHSCTNEKRENFEVAGSLLKFLTKKLMERSEGHVKLQLFRKPNRIHPVLLCLH